MAGDGAEALKLLRQGGPHADAPRPNLIVLDLNMSRMDGRQTLAAIKTDPRLRAIPVVVFTTSSAESDVLSSYHSYASAYVTKPLNLDDLERVVAQIARFYTTVSTLLPPGQHAA